MDRARLTLRGVQTAALVNVVVTVAKVVPILVFIAIAAVGFKAGLFTADFWGKTTQIDGAPLGDTMSQVKNMMLVTVWVFIGIEGAVGLLAARRQAARTSAAPPCSASSACWRCCSWSTCCPTA